MTGFALPSDTGEIRALWDSCFPEEPEFSDLFFAKMFKSDTCLVLREDGIIKATAQMLPYELKDVGKVTYIYGAATHPDFRRQGLMRRLLEASFELDKKRGFAASILIPANEALYGFYARLGYKTRFYIREGKPRMSGADLTGYALRAASEEDIVFMDALYRRELGTGYIVRSRSFWAEQISMFRELGGDALILTKDSRAVGYGFLSDGFLQEAFGNPDVTAALAGADKYAGCGGDTPIGMAYAYKPLPEKMYLNLMYN